MKMALYLFILANFFIHDSFFYDKILNDFPSKSYYVVINVSNKDYKGQVAVTSADLFWYLSQKRKINEIEFQSLVKQKLINKDTFDINEEGLLRAGFHKIPIIRKISKYKLKNKQRFLNKYFYPESFVCKEGVSPEEQNAIIAKLFEWEIATSVDDISGFIMIPYEFSPFRTKVH